MGVREIDRSLEQWHMGVKDLRQRVILAPTPRERERRYAILLLAQGLTAAATAEALERDPHTIGRWASAFGEGGPAALIFEQTGGSLGPFHFPFGQLSPFVVSLSNHERTVLRQAQDERESQE